MIWKVFQNCPLQVSSVQEDELWIIDEASRLPQPIIDHILKTWCESNRWPVLLFLGDLRQVGAIGRGNLRSSSMFAQCVDELPLYGSQRSKDNELLKILDAIKDAPPSQSVLEALQADGRVLTERWDDNLAPMLFPAGPGTHPTCLTVTNEGADTVNTAVLSHLARCQPGATYVDVFDQHRRVYKLLLFRGARVMITLNKDVGKLLMNGQVAVVVSILDEFVVLQFADGSTAALPLTRVWQKNQKLVRAFSLAGGYAMTIHKSQGLTLPKAIVYWDSPHVQEGLGYTALSRVRCLKDITFIGSLRKAYFRPTCFE